MRPAVEKHSTSSVEADSTLLFDQVFPLHNFSAFDFAVLVIFALLMVAPLRMTVLCCWLPRSAVLSWLSNDCERPTVHWTIRFRSVLLAVAPVDDQVNVCVPVLEIMFVHE